MVKKIELNYYRKISVKKLEPSEIWGPGTKKTSMRVKKN